jgi:hypothetical protein
MNALLSAMVLWLTANYGLPAADRHPVVRFAQPTEILLFRYRAFTPESRRQILATHAAAPDRQPSIVAVYDETNRTILLPDGWSGRTPAELSILLHELVHHLQTAAGLNYECPAARERPAYLAQEKWLGLFNLSLASEFHIDAFTLKVATECAY